MSAPQGSSGTTATAVSALALAEAARRAQLEIRRQMLADVARAWPLLNFQHIDRSWPVWLRVVSALLSRYHAQSAQGGALFYRAARQAAIGDPGATDAVKLASPPSDTWLARALGFSAVGVFRQQTVDLGRPADIAERAALTRTLGTAARIVQDGSRTTVVDSAKADPAAIGWYRVTDGAPCAFCALLASRGVVDGSTMYRSRTTASFEAHNDCGCSAAPAFSRNQELPAVSQRAAEVYQARGHGDPLVAFRKAWRDHQSQRTAS